jgi:hypothetical protein
MREEIASELKVLISRGGRFLDLLKNLKNINVSYSEICSLYRKHVSLSATKSDKVIAILYRLNVLGVVMNRDKTHYFYMDNNEYPLKTRAGLMVHYAFRDYLKLV